MDNIVEVWSAAKSTESDELMNLYSPLVADNFAKLYQQKEKFLSKTISTSFKTLLERVPQENVTEDVKIQIPK